MSDALAIVEIQVAHAAGGVTSSLVSLRPH